MVSIHATKSQVRHLKSVTYARFDGQAINVFGDSKPRLNFRRYSGDTVGIRITVAVHF
jgi:hypothetical protein